MRFRRANDDPLWTLTSDSPTTDTAVPTPLTHAELKAVALARRVEYLEVQLEQADACIDDLLQRLFETRAQMVAAVERAHAETEARDRAEARMTRA